MKRKRKPISSVTGLVLMAVCVAWAVVAMKQLNTPGADPGGYGGFVVIAAMNIVTPIGLICGVISLIRKERPVFLSWLLVAITSAPIIGLLAKRLM